MPVLQNKSIIKVLLTFLVSYALFLVLWLQIKGPYVIGMTHAASAVVSVFKDVELQEVIPEGKTLRATFLPLRHNANMLIDITVVPSTFTFNAPLTFALMVCLYPFIGRRRRAYAEGLVVLLLVHLVYVFSLEAKELTDVFADFGFEKNDGIHFFLYEFLWSFTDNMVIRFEPFLIGFYMYIKFRK